jgi:AraC family transcriptional regulator
MNLKRLAADGIVAEYGRMLPGEGQSRTPGNAIGVAFTPQRRAAWSVGGDKRLGGEIAPSSVLITPAEGLEWHAWDLTSDSIEIWLDREKLSELSFEHGGPAHIEFDLHDRIRDPIIVDIAARIRRLLCMEGPSPDRLAEIGQELSEHFLRRYVDVRISHKVRPLDQRRLSRVLDFIDADVGASLTVDQLAGVAAMSPFHFARSFKAATGSSPHAFIVARRMDRAAALLRLPALPVADAAEATGFVSLPHFRRHFRDHWGMAPGDFARVAER